MAGINWELLEKAARALVDHNIKCEMSVYRSDRNGTNVCQISIEEPCGHAGCFIGSCPFLGIEELELIQGDLSAGAVRWSRYCLRVFGICPIRHEELWDYLFGAGQSGHPEDILNRVMDAKEKWGKENSND